MSVGALNLRVNVDEKRLVVSAGDPRTYLLPSLQSGDNVPVVFQLLCIDPDGGINNGLLITNPASYGLKIGLFDSAGATLAYQNTFTINADDKTWTGFLDLSHAAIATLLTSVTSVNTCILEIEITDTLGNTRTVFQDTQVTIQKSYITGATTGVPATDTAATTGWTLATFLTKAATTGDYDSKIWKSADGSLFVMTVDNDGQIHTDKIT